MPVRESQGANTRALTIVAFSATAGAFVEFYDFFIYGYAATSASLATSAIAWGESSPSCSTLRSSESPHA